MAKKRAPKVPPKVLDFEDMPADVPVVPEAPRYNAEGVLLNPEKFNVSPEGLVTPKGGL